jgi:hypothetical protein
MKKVLAISSGSNSRVYSGLIREKVGAGGTAILGYRIPLASDDGIFGLAGFTRT